MARKSSADPSARYVRVGGKSRNYIDRQTGKQYSRRQYDALIKRTAEKKERSTGPKSDKRKVDEYRARLKYEAQVRKFRDYQAAQGNRMKVRDIRNSDEMKAVIKGLNSKSQKMKLKSLKALGLRDGIPDSVPIGDTNSWIQSGRPMTWKGATL